MLSAKFNSAGFKGISWNRKCRETTNDVDFILSDDSGLTPISKASYADTIHHRLYPPYYTGSDMGIWFNIFLKY